MDAALIKERELFKKRALAQPSVERKVKKDEPANKKAKLPHKAKSNWSTPSPAPPIDYKTAVPTSSHKFSLLHKVIEYLKKRHHRGDNYPLSLHDLLDEANMTDLSPKHRLWLSSEALLHNSKVDVIDGNMFKFKPSLPISTRKELLVYLKRTERRGMGGVYEEHVEEALPDAKKHIDKLLELGKIIVIQRTDKKRVLHFKDTGTEAEYNVDEEFVKLWRTVAVDNLDDKTIDDYLQKQGISSMEHVGLRRVAQPPPSNADANKQLSLPVRPGVQAEPTWERATRAQPKRKGNRKGKNFKKLNDHLDGVLKDYSDKK